VEGRNIVYDRVYASNDLSRLPELAAGLVSRGPNLIYTPSGEPAEAVMAKTRAIPIVHGSMSDAVERGWVKSLAHPGGNFTGVVNIGPELGGKRFQLLKEALPKATRVGVLVNPFRANEFKLIEQAAAALSVSVVPVTVREPKDLDAALGSLAKNRIEALLLTHSSLFVTERGRILDFAAKQRIPVIAHRSDITNDGALMSYSSILSEQIRRAAHLADKILKGAKPADIPMEQPTKFELVINLKTARNLGIAIPQELRLRADRVIE
jgi:putative ABC transport system substrate-binding protein